VRALRAFYSPADRADWYREVSSYPKTRNNHCVQQQLANPKEVSEENTTFKDDANFNVGTPKSASASAPPISSLEAELGKLKMRALNQRAIDVGATAEELETAQEGGKDTVIALIVSKKVNAIDKLRSELEALTIGQLSRRALINSVNGDAFQTAHDADDPHAAIVKLIIEMKTETDTKTKLELELDLLDPEPESEPEPEPEP